MNKRHIHHIMEPAPERTALKGRNEITNDDYECVECHKTHKEMIYEMETEKGMTRTVSDEEYQRIKSLRRVA